METKEGEKGNDKYGMKIYCLEFSAKLFLMNYHISIFEPFRLKTIAYKNIENKNLQIIDIILFPFS